MSYESNLPISFQLLGKLISMDYWWINVAHDLIVPEILGLIVKVSTT